MEKHSSSISNFRLFLFKIVLPFLLLLSAICFVFIIYFEQKVVLKSHIGGAYKINKILREVDPDEIPIFGSSRAEMGLIPDTLGKHFFNYGLYHTRIDVALFFMKQECKKKKHNPWMIINFDFEGLSSNIGDISNYLYNATDPEVKKLMSSDYKFYYSIPMVKYFGRFENIYRSYLTEKTEATKVVNKGAVMETQVIGKKEFARVMDKRNSNPITFEYDKKLNDDLVNILNNNKDRKFVFVVAPYYPNCYNDTNVIPFNNYLNFLRKFPNVYVFDCGHMDLPDSLYFNTSHVNFKGAIQYSRALRDSLRKIGLTDM